MLKLNPTTYYQQVKADPEDEVKIIVGDDKQPDFKPQFKLERWGNEINFSLRAKEEVGAKLKELPDGTIVYEARDYEVHQYDKPDASEEGGFEFEWVLKTKPATNILTATIQSKGLSFYYQPPLTPEEIVEGASRPDNIIGSYAVYHSTKSNHKVGDKNYRCGKAFHIYRPKAIDANGAETWADLNIDEAKGILSVIVPQKFLDDAVYPVRVDPTFGYTTQGASVTNIASATSDSSIRNGTNYTLSETAIVNKITASLKTLAGTEAVDIIVFANSTDSIGSGSHGQSIATTERLNLSITTTLTDYDFTAASEQLSVGNFILNAVGNGVDVVTNDIQIAVDVVASNNYYRETFTGAGSYEASKENPWTSAVTGSNRKYSIYATYTASGGTVTPTLMMMGVGT